MIPDYRHWCLPATMNRDTLAPTARYSFNWNCYKEVRLSFSVEGFILVDLKHLTTSLVLLDQILTPSLPNNYMLPTYY